MELKAENCFHSKALRQIFDRVLNTPLGILGKIPQFQLIFWCGNFVEQHSFHTRKLGEITVFYAVVCFEEKITKRLNCLRYLKLDTRLLC